MRARSFNTGSPPATSRYCPTTRPMLPPDSLVLLPTPSLLPSASLLLLPTPSLLPPAPLLLPLKRPCSLSRSKMVIYNPQFGGVYNIYILICHYIKTALYAGQANILLRLPNLASLVSLHISQAPHAAIDSNCHIIHWIYQRPVPVL